MRTAADIAREIAATETVLAKLRRERKSVQAADRMRRNHRDPAFEAKIRAGQRAMLADETRRAEFVRNQRQAALRTRGLPTMTREQRRTYANILRNGGDRMGALAAVLRI
jgi:hypothetical protein